MTFLDIIENNKEKFLKYNNAKLQRFQELFPSKSIGMAINSIPLLLSVNDKKLPGYIDGDVPTGIINYKPGEQMIKYIRSRFKCGNLTINTSQPFIQMLAVMGSIGTVAYTKKSDFDFWVCIDSQSIQKKYLNNFKKKVNAIQEWIKKDIRTEIHLFINDIENIKKNLFAEDKDEAYGTTIGTLLKDEFYRTSIIIAGKIPFWWVVPQHTLEKEYNRFYNQLPSDMKENVFIDLGNLIEISREDFPGAALFQIIKSLGSPFKSIIKIGVLEKYLFKSNISPLLSQKVKANIHRDNLTNKIIDSYILMFDEVYDYYESTIKDDRILNILRQNLYLKINPRLSRYAGMKKSKNLPYNVSIMFDYVKVWGWSDSEITSLDNFDKWDYNRVIDFWNDTKKFMLLSYQKILKELPSLNLSRKISESDFKLLSRKIKTYFTPKPNKIDQYITFKDTPCEPVLYIEPHSIGIKEAEWRLYKNTSDSKGNIDPTTLKTEKDLVKLLSWASINEIFDPKFSRLKIHSGYQRINQNLVVNLIGEISKLFAEKRIPPENEYFLSDSFNTVNMIILNFNMENTDNIKTIYHLYQTSWGESYIDFYKSEKSIIDILQSVLRGGIKLKREFQDCCSVVSPEPVKPIYKNIEKLFRNTYDYIVRKDATKALCMIAFTGNNYITVNRDMNDNISIISHNNIIKLLLAVSLKPFNNIDINFYGNNKQIEKLKLIYEKKKENAISIIYEEKNNYLFIYVIDERGNLFTFIKPFIQKDEALLSMYIFSKNIIMQINNFNYLPDINKNISIYQLLTDKDGNFSFSFETASVTEMYMKKFKMNSGISVKISKYKTDTKYYSLSLPDKSSTEFMPVKLLKEKFNSIASHTKITNLINNIDFQDKEEIDIKKGSSQYFIEKYKLELLLNKKNL